MDPVQRRNPTPGSVIDALQWRNDRAFANFPDAADSASLAPPALEHPFPNRPRVLVADDNPSSQWEACELLARWGITAVLAADGAEAVALACGHDFDLILMDLQMPVLDGLSATAQIRRFERDRSCARAPVVAYTSSPLGGNVLRDFGLDAVLEKPCDATSLEECLLRWCPAQTWVPAPTSASARP